MGEGQGRRASARYGSAHREDTTGRRGPAVGRASGRGSSGREEREMEGDAQTCRDGERVKVKGHTRPLKFIRTCSSRSSKICFVFCTYATCQHRKQNYAVKSEETISHRIVVSFVQPAAACLLFGAFCRTLSKQDGRRRTQRSTAQGNWV